jgi:hypothetical protein
MTPWELKIINEEAFEALVEFLSKKDRCPHSEAEVGLLDDEENDYSIVTEHEPNFKRGFLHRSLKSMQFRLNVGSMGEAAFYERERKVWVHGWGL